MTIQQRAKDTCDAFISEGYLKAIERTLRELIEECAKIADVEAEGASTYQWQHACEEVAEKIRALAGGGGS